jgi:hypothetical protein
MPEVHFAGPEGRLEGRYHPNPGEGAPIALVLHPHPQFGGTMNNKVIYNLYYTLHELGFSVLRFNFRGVGCRFRARLSSGNEPQCPPVLGCRIFLRGMDLDATADASPGNQRVRLGFSPGEYV